MPITTVVAETNAVVSIAPTPTIAFESNCVMAMGAATPITTPADELSESRRPVGADRERDADFLRALSHGVGDEAVDARSG